DATGTFPITSTNDPGILQVRITTGPDASKYYSTDIKITGTSWTQIYPAAPTATATTTTLTVTPNPSTVGQSVALSAVETATGGSHPAGTIQFKDGSANLGSAVTVDAAGKASATSSTLTAGSHPITAVFTPTATGFSGSTSTAVSQQVSSSAVTTTTVLTASPASPVVTPTPTTLSAAITPAGAAGTVQFLDGTSNLGAAVAVSGGAAQTTTTLAVGTHSLTAKFIPTDATAFTGSVSAAASYRVDPQPAQTTTTDLSVSPAGPVQTGELVTLTGTVTPSTAPGAFQFYDGTTALGAPAGSSSAGAQLISSSLAAGTHQLSVKFIPTNAANYGSSTSPTRTLVVKAPPTATSTAVTISPAAKAVVGSSVTYRATLSPAASAGQVQFAEDGSPIGNPVVVAGGSASLAATATGLGTHSITAAFTPTDASVYLASNGTATLTVIAPAVATTTTLQLTPAGPVDFGTAVSLTASVPTPGAAGSVRFSDGTKVLDTVALTAGSATLSTSGLASGSHSLTATFLPADTDAFVDSTSAAVSLVVNAQQTATVLTATPDTLVSAGTSVSLKAALTPAGAVGTVQFLDSSTVIGNAMVSAGSASLKVTDLTVGDHVLTAVFTPTDAAQYVSSTSTAVNLKVKDAATLGDTTVGGKTVASGAQLPPGATVTLTAAGFVPGESVRVVLGST
ncbi:MAG: Ig-like domain-containing protein, partial [Actinomycetota bacterium]|nr:Ig-like domain-containing protein [Actinomycetota bacterium]